MSGFLGSFAGSLTAVTLATLAVRAFHSARWGRFMCRHRGHLSPPEHIVQAAAHAAHSRGCPTGTTISAMCPRCGGDAPIGVLS